MATRAEIAVGARPTEPAQGGIRTFRQAHRWLLIPLLITLLGFTPSYFLKLGEATWPQHLHGLSATLWFVLLIVQPYFATHGRLALHRVLGPLGLVLAGMVVASALGVIPANIENARNPELPPFFPPAFFYGISFVDLVIAIGFGISVVMAMRNVRRPRDHALWMISTALWALSPGLVRLMAFSMIFTVGVEGSTLIDFVVLATFPIVAAIVALMIRLRQAHPALLLALIGNLLAFLVAWMGDNETWRALADSLFT
ncbi:MAG: hypothetical protein RQ847_09005 [Wenzhouxiangellaceae bacterium]|nr:hypothetical protein [Wenzhouxiangellaceae bacterium]